MFVCVRFACDEVGEARLLHLASTVQRRLLPPRKTHQMTDALNTTTTSKKKKKGILSCPVYVCVRWHFGQSVSVSEKRGLCFFFFCVCVPVPLHAKPFAALHQRVINTFNILLFFSSVTLGCSCCYTLKSIRYVVVTQQCGNRKTKTERQAAWIIGSGKPTAPR